MPLPQWTNEPAESKTQEFYVRFGGQSLHWATDMNRSRRHKLILFTLCVVCTGAVLTLWEIEFTPLHRAETYL